MRKITALLVIPAALALTPVASAQLGGNLIVNITSPAPGARVRATIPVNASVTIVGSLLVSSVQFKVDGVNLGAADTTAPYSVPWNTTSVSAGTHTLTAVARDLLGLQYTSNPVTVTVDNIPPTVTINQATGQADPTRGSPISFTAVFSEAVTDFTAADVALSGTAGGSKNVAVTGGPSTFNVAVSGMTSGTLLATIAAGSAGDLAGNGNTASSSTDNAVTFDAVAPVISLTAPANGATVSGMVTIAATASDATGVTSVQFRIDGADFGGPDTTAPYQVSWNSAASAEGAHTLTAVASDTVGNVGTAAAVTVSVANNTTVTRLEDANGAITYTPPNTWILGYTGGYPWSAGTASLGFTAGQRATLNFTGTGVKWIGFRGPQTGIANVYLDGALVATVDAYAAAEATDAVLFTASGLAAVPHTLAIEVTRTKNASAVDYYVVVDAFDVTGAVSAPDGTPPTVSISTPASGSTVSGLVPITASASDNVGVAGVRFFADGAPIGAEDTTAPYSAAWDTASAADGGHTLTAVARDAAGNTTTSAAVTVSVSNASSTVTAARFEETAQQIVFTPGTADVGRPPLWWHGSRSRGWSNTTASFNRSVGARASFTFSGTRVSWVGFRAFWAGIANVYVDGAFVAEIDLFLPRCTDAEKAQGCDDERDNEVVFTATGLAAGVHTLTVESTGRKHGTASCNPDPASGDPKNCAADYAVVLDAFDVVPGGSPAAAGARAEETAAAVTYVGTWTAGDTSQLWSGATAARSSTAGSRAQFTFTGSAVQLVGYKGPETGIARVFLDGAFHAEIDTFSPARIQTVVFSATDLASGRHTVEIEVTGQKHANATGHSIFVDAFDVQSRFEDRHAAVVYAPAGNWVRENMDYAWSGTTANAGGGTASYSSTAGATATFTFSGTGVSWIGFRSPLAGIADVWLDGAPVGQFDLYAATDQVRVPIYTVSGLTPGTHTLRIDVTGQKNPAASAAVVVVDAFDVVPSAPGPLVRRFQQSDAAYPNGGWSTTTPSNLDSGRTVVVSSTRGSRVELTFTGTAVRWIGQRLRDTGVARVSLDGALITTIDTSAPIQDEYQAAIFTATGLVQGSHTLAIEVVAGNGEPEGAPVRRVIVDAFEVY